TRCARDAVRAGRLALMAGVVLLVLGAPGRSAGARECRDETPLPADVRMIAPGTDVPAAAARFAGAWLGPWKSSPRDTGSGALVVEEVLPSGHARIVYSRGAWKPLAYHPRYWRATGRVVDGKLQFVLPGLDRSPFEYRFIGGVLTGSFRGAGN